MKRCEGGDYVEALEGFKFLFMVEINNKDAAKIVPSFECNTSILSIVLVYGYGELHIFQRLGHFSLLGHIKYKCCTLQINHTVVKF